MSKYLKSKLLSEFAEIHHGTYVYSPPFKKEGKFNVDRDKLYKALDLDKKDSLFMGIQEHTDDIFVVKEPIHDGQIHMIPSNDALITNQKSIPLIVYTADCLPIFIYDPIKKVVAIAHAGWKGVLEKIAVKTIKKMEKEFGSKRKNVLVYVGPSIGPCCYDHATSGRSDLFKKYKEGEEERDGVFFINLWDALEQDLLEFGLPPENLENPRICTGCQKDGFASHHVEKEKRKSSNISMIEIV